MASRGPAGAKRPAADCKDCNTPRNRIPLLSLGTLPSFNFGSVRLEDDAIKSQCGALATIGWLTPFGPARSIALLA